MATQQTITKKRNETVRVSVDVSNINNAAYLASFVGFRVNYPAAILTPVGTGAGNAVQFEDGNIFSGQDVDTIANNQSVDGAFFVYVSKALKTAPQADVLAQARVITLLFTAVGFGQGDIAITAIKGGRVVDGTPQEYEASADTDALTVQELVEALPPVLHFTVEVV